MNDAMQYTWTPPPDLVTQSDLTPFLRSTGQPDYDVPAAKADADPHG
jgi:acetyl-CoA synthetase